MEMTEHSPNRVPFLNSLLAKSIGIALLFTAVGLAARQLISASAPGWLVPAIEALCFLAPAVAIYLLAIRPYGALQDAIGALREGRFDLSLAAATRRDEIGIAARNLLQLAGEFEDSSRGSADAAFQGAAFNGSSAAMMLLDQDFRILHMNPALEKLMVDYRDAFVSDVPDFDHKKIIGGNMDMFHAKRPQVRKILSDPKNLPYQGNIRLGEERLTIEVSWVAGPDGTHLGYVAEWKRVTDEQRKDALIGALDSAQLRVEMSPDGAVINANDAFLGLCERGIEQLHGLELLDRISLDGQPVASRLKAGEAITGTFTVDIPRIGMRLIEGVLAPAKDFAGRVMLSALIGRDVTEERRATDERAERDERTRKEQAHVVATLGSALGDLANGRLSTRIAQEFPADYEKLRVDFNAASENLAAAIALVVESAQSIRNEANEITSASQDLNRRTEQQAATLEQTAAALDELTASVQSAASVAEAARSMVETTQERAKKSGKVVRDTINAMQEIAEGSAKISKITSVIDEIAFQTNLLALNAGVEAARAGEAGRGFAVVASEVRALAQRSSEAAREIAVLIETSTSQVRRGVDLVDEAGNVIGEIEFSVGEVKDQITGIAGSSAEQATGIKEINVAVNQLDQVTQQNAALSEQTNAATQSLLSMSAALIDNTAKFDVSGIAANAAPGPKAETAVFGSRRSAPPKLAVAGGQAVSTAAEDWEEF